MALIGVCEDEPALRSVLLRALRSMGHEAVAASTGAEAMETFTEKRPAVMLMDIGLPDADGRDVCMALRSAGIASPVLFLTARDGMHDKVAGFAAGGDDYLTKPFDLDEVRVRIDALLRRSEHVPTSVDEEPRLDSARHALIVGTASATLTPTEFRLLGRLMAEPGVPVRRRALIAAGWPHGESVSSNTLDSYIRRLRIKLEGLGVAGINTDRGVGYQWR